MTEDVMSPLEGVNAIVGLTDKRKIQLISNFLQDGHRYSGEPEIISFSGKSGIRPSKIENLPSKF